MNYNELIEQLKAYYANTLIIQYHNKPKAKATIEMLVELIFHKAMLLQIRDAFDWKTAEGEQLDIIGKWVGVSRFYSFKTITSKKLAYPQYSRLLPTPTTDIVQGGYSTYATFNDNNGGQLTYKDLESLNSKLSDDDFKTVIGLKIIFNNINHVAGEIDQAIWDYFNGDIYTTWSDNTIIYNYKPEYLEILQVCLNKGVLPAPIGTTIQLRGI